VTAFDISTFFVFFFSFVFNEPKRLSDQRFFFFLSFIRGLDSAASPFKMILFDILTFSMPASWDVSRSSLTLQITELLKDYTFLFYDIPSLV